MTQPEQHALVDVIQYMKVASRRIGKEARDGDERSQLLIMMYKSFYQSRDEFSFELLWQQIVGDVYRQKLRLGAWPAEAPLSLREDLSGTWEG